jgi:hypothetical protein
MLPTDGFRFGIEHEFPVIDSDGRFCDFSNITFEDLDGTLATLPVTESDYPGLRVGDLGIKLKRWYVEGFERFSESGEYLITLPKGLEIRTPICASLDEAFATLLGDIAKWEKAGHEHGYRAARTAFNPFQIEFVPRPALNDWEVAHRQSPEEQTAHIHMLTYGPDISFSHPGLTAEQTIDIGKKLTFYSPYIVPFSFSSPFYAGELWGGYSRRTYYRTGPRPAVLVHVGSETELIPSFPTLTDRARVGAEAGRIEFKAFDCPPDTELYRSLGTLLLGLALDETLPGRALVPDQSLHQLSATVAFDDPELRRRTHEVVDAAHLALPEERRPLLEPLWGMLATRRTPAHAMVEEFERTGDILAAIR